MFVKPAQRVQKFRFPFVGKTIAYTDKAHGPGYKDAHGKNEKRIFSKHIKETAPPAFAAFKFYQVNHNW